MTDKPVLAFDCSTPAASVALSVAGAVELVSIAQGRQAAELVPAIDGLMRGHGITYGQLGAIVTTVGPGSFTGLRIALATMHGLVLAVPVPVPVKTVTSLEAVVWELARRDNPPVHTIIALNAGKGEAFCQKFALEGGVPRAVSDISLIPLGDVPIGAAGNAVPGDTALYFPGPSAAVLCEIAPLLPTVELAQVLPLYIRPPDAKIPQPLPWLKKEVV